MITVIMSVYNEKEEWLKKSIESILNQTYKNFEYIITLDDPYNSSLENIIKFYASIDSRIIYRKNINNIGLTNSLNNMLKIANGEYVARMDADDISLPDRFEKQLKYLIENNLDICGSNVIQFYDNIDVNVIKNPYNFEDVKKYIYFRNCVAHPTFFVKKSVYDKLGGYNEVPTCEDYDFLLRAIGKKYKVGNVPEVLLKYRLSPNSISRKNLGKQAVLSKYISNFYKKNCGIITDEIISKYLKTNNCKNKIKKYNKYCFNKNQLLKYKKNNKFLYIIYLFKMISIFDLFLENIYLRIKLKKMV